MMPALLAVSLLAILLLGYQALLSWSRFQRGQGAARRPFRPFDEDEDEDESEVD